jgi:hypothetical protein
MTLWIIRKSDFRSSLVPRTWHRIDDWIASTGGVKGAIIDISGSEVVVPVKTYNYAYTEIQ